MTYEHARDLNLTYDSGRGYWHFVLYIEPPHGAGSALNGGKIMQASTSRYAAEWINRLTECDPDALHVALVGKNDAPNLWHPCVYEDPESPSAIARDGCVCWQTFHDPVTWLPVAAHHFRTVSGNHEYWRHFTFTPLALPEKERLDRLIIDSEADSIWVRTDQGNLHFLPEARGAGYSVGYGGGGPTELARMIEKIVQMDGYGVAAGTSRGMPNEKVMSWVSSKAADRTQELGLEQLKLLCRTGSVA
ncbi:hypothetical protein [Micromonospora hortensis]|uniref:hypothetical protein n=1 Tax=Micromonospora hortensis TaxID=2911209 RepID=UPI001EE7D24A|nr:hypothetical protein [Micromonospora hortensis]MCG5452941.1 hypothetical protein [Micromonospora hortensis]